MAQTDEFIRAVKAKQVEKVRELLDAGVTVDSRQNDKEAETALMLAVRADDLETVQLLLSRGADVDARTMDIKYSALIYASNKPAIAKLLIDAGATVGMPDAYGQSALMSAARSDCGEVAAMLLENGANPKAKDMFGESPLHYAEINSKRNVLPLLKAAAGLEQEAKAPETKTRDAPSAMRPVFESFKKMFRRKTPSSPVAEYSTNELIRMLSVLTGKRATWQFEDGTVGSNPVPLTERQIGTELNRRGGKTLMLAAHRESKGGRMLEIGWDGIGDWRG